MTETPAPPKRGVGQQALKLAFLVAAVALGVAACNASQTDDGEATTDGSEQVESPAQTDAGLLVTAFESDTVLCDRTNQTLGEVRGALPGEQILLTSPMPVNLPETFADQSGRFVMAWNCDPTESRMQWEIRAVGHDSNRAV